MFWKFTNIFFSAQFLVTNTIRNESIGAITPEKKSRVFVLDSFFKNFQFICDFKTKILKNPMFKSIFKKFEMSRGTNFLFKRECST